MKRNLFKLVTVTLITATLVFFMTTMMVQAQGSDDFDTYVLQLQPPNKEAEANIWPAMHHLLTRLKERGLVQQFEIVPKENLIYVSATPQGLYPLRELDWILKIERQTDSGSQVVYNGQPSQAEIALAPNDVTGMVDLPDGTPVEGITVNADKVEGFGLDSDSTNASGMYSMTLDSDGLWDIYLSPNVPSAYPNYARPLDWKRRLNITSDSVQDFTLIPISYTITGTVRVTGTGTAIFQAEVINDRRDGGHDDFDWTDINGLYELEATTGPYTVTLNATSQSDGYAPPFGFEGEIVTVSDASVGDVDLWVWPLNWVISGTVTDKETSAPIGGVGLELHRMDDLYNEYNVETASGGMTGTYAVSVTNGVYEISLDSFGQPSGYALPVTDTQTVTVTDGNVPDVDFQLIPLDKRIQGRVTDKESGMGVSGINMSIDAVEGAYESSSATTDASGYYTFTVSEGEYDVSLPASWVLPDDYALPPTTTQRVTVGSSDVSDVDFVLLPRNKSISGRVTVQGTATGVAGVEMRLDPDYVFTDTNSSGYYTFTNIAEGNYTVRVDDVPAGYGVLDPSDQKVTVTETDRTDVDFELLVADQTIRGTVSEAGGGGLAGVTVGAFAYDANFDYDSDTTTDASGAYTLTVPEGKFRVRLILPSGYAGRRQLRARSGSNGVDFVLHDRSQTIMGQVTDHEGTPLENVSIYAENYGCFDTLSTRDYWSGQDASAFTDASGYYTLTVLSGSYEVSAYKTGYPTPPYQSAEAGDSGVDFVMPEGFLIRGRVTGITPGGGTLVLPGAWVSARATGECVSSRHDASVSTDASGYYTLTVDAGTYEVSADQWKYDASATQTVSVGPDQSGVDFALTARYHVTGTVRYPNGQPVVSAHVDVHSGPSYSSDWTDADGQYELWLSAGTYDLEAWISNWPDPDLVTDLAVMTDTFNVNFTAPQAYTVTGVVRDNAGMLWSDVWVTADDQDAINENEWDITDDEGAYALRVRRGGTYQFYPERYTYPSNPLPITLTVTADTANVDFQFGNVVTVTGMVSDTFSTPVPNAEVEAYGWGTNGAWNPSDAYTFYDGTYELFIAQGSYEGYADKGTCYVDSGTQSFTLGAAGLSDLDFTITPLAGTVMGSVTDNRGGQVCDAEITIEYPGGSGFTTVDTIDDRRGQSNVGDYRVLLPLGDWQMSASKEGYGPGETVSRTISLNTLGQVLSGQDFELAVLEYLYLPVILKNQ